MAPFIKLPGPPICGFAQFFEEPVFGAVEIDDPRKGGVAMNVYCARTNCLRMLSTFVGEDVESFGWQRDGYRRVDGRRSEGRRDRGPSP